MSKNSKTTHLHRNIWALSVVSLLTDVSSEMIFNLLPLFLYNILGTRTSVIGLIEGVAETTASFVKILSGAWSDRLGKRKWLAVAGYGLSAIAKPFMYFAATWGSVLGIRFTDRVGKGIRTAPRDALLAGSASPKTRGFAFGLHRAGDTAGAFIGLGIAAWVIWRTQAGQAALERSTFQEIVLLSILPATLAVLVLILFVHDVESPAGPSHTTVRTHWKQIDRRFFIFVAIMIIFTLGNSSDAFIILLASERGLSALQITGMLLTYTAIYSILSTPAGAISDRIGRPIVLLSGWLLYALVYLGLAFSQTGWQVWALFGVYGIYYAITEGTAKALVADFVPQHQRGVAYGLFNAAIGFSALPASLLAGALWQGVGKWPGFGPSAPFITGACLAMLAVGLYYFLVFRRISAGERLKT
jgi:MFS family permease